MTTLLQRHESVGRIVREHPSLSRLFEQAKIDYCCGGQKTLVEACRQRGIDPEAFISELETTVNHEETEEINFNDFSLTELVNHIEQTHHAYLHSELPRLEKMTAKVAAVHGEEELRLHQINAVFLPFSQELTRHVMKEEKFLFPMIRQLDAGTLPNAHCGDDPQFHCGSIANPIRQMKLEHDEEHDETGLILAQLRKLSDDYTPPQWACNTYRALFDALAYFEADMRQHVHKENNILFPRAQSRA